jgi:hypothetical protein
MLRLVIPVVLALVGAGAGIGAGLYLRPKPEPEVHVEFDPSAPCGEVPADGAAPGAANAGNAHAASDDGHDAEEGDSATEFVKLNNQFVVPVMEGDTIVSLVVLSLSLETPPGGGEVIYAREPKLRDSFLQVLFDHANAGGFSGAFTSGNRIQMLRQSLLTAAQMAIGRTAIDVLVTDIARQDV